jgi:hypothetical protein
MRPDFDGREGMLLASRTSRTVPSRQQRHGYPGAAGCPQANYNCSLMRSAAMGTPWLTLLAIWHTQRTGNGWNHGVPEGFKL